MIALARALSIQGWMHEHNLYWLAEQAAQHHTIVEIGAWKGRVTRALADHTPGTVYVVEHFGGSARERDVVDDLLAREGAVLVCGGLGGVMEAAARGCAAEGGTSIGILPGATRARARLVTRPLASTVAGQRR